MKKMITLLLAITMLCAGTTVFASGNKGVSKDNGGWTVDGQPGWSYDWDLSGGAKNYITNRSVAFYLQLDGLQMDTSGNVSSRPKTLFTEKIATSTLTEKNRTADYTVVLGDNVSSDDVISEVESAPTVDESFDQVRDQLMYKGYIRSNKGEVVPWASLNTKNYGIEWYVLKYESDGWHVDGRILDLSTNNIIDIVIPDDPKDIPEEAYGEDKTDTDKDNTKDDNSDKDNDSKDEPVETEDKSINLKGARFAYIFGYEPEIETTVDENGNEVSKAAICMGMDDNVTVEQVSAMLMRLLDQELYTKGHKYPITPSVSPYRNEWFARGLAYQCSVGGLDSEGDLPLGDIKRGLVAKLVSHALNLNLSSDVPFEDIAGNEYEEDIKKVYAYGYMQGLSKTEFAPDAIMTRAEFCSLFNNIIGRNDMGLTAIDADGNEYEITAKDYSFVDMDPSHWGYKACLKATSAYDDNGYVSISIRQENMRNILDEFDSQLIY